MSWSAFRCFREAMSWFNFRLARISFVLLLSISLLTGSTDKHDLKHILASGPISLDYETVKQHVCARSMVDRLICEDLDFLGYFQCDEKCDPTELKISKAEKRKVVPCEERRLKNIERVFQKDPSDFARKCVEIHRCQSANVEIRMDGLGHYIYKVNKKIMLDLNSGLSRSYKSYFTESVRKSAIYLKNVSSLGDAYCHKVRADDDPSTYNESVEYLHANFQCYKVPPLDEWFNTRWLLPSNSYKDDPDRDPRCFAVTFSPNTCGTACNERVQQEFQLNYWKGHEDDAITCGSDATISEEQFVVAIHLRLGDLLHPPDLQYTQDKLNRIPYYHARLKHSIEGFEKTLKYIDKSFSDMADEHGLRILVVSDLPTTSTEHDLNELFRGDIWQQSLRLRAIPDSIYNDGMSQHVLISHQLSSLPVIDLMLDSNPLVGLHCLGKADLMVEPSSSYFGNLAVMINRGTAITPGNGLKYFDTKKIDVQRKSKIVEANEDNLEEVDVFNKKKSEQSVAEDED